MNKRITPRERGLLKGAIRRVFARSELRRKVMDAAVIVHKDTERPRVTKWIRCTACKQPYPKYLAELDHEIPVVSLNSSFEEQGADVTIDRTWCVESNLKPICKPCHRLKSKEERKARKAAKAKNVK